MGSCAVKKLKKATRRKLVDYDSDSEIAFSLRRKKSNELDSKHMFSEQSKRRNK